MSNTKYMNRIASAQRDMNPLGNSLNKQSPFMNKNLAKKGAPNFNKFERSNEATDLFNKYQK
jgi:hypothetical protein